MSNQVCDATEISEKITFILQNSTYNLQDIAALLDIDLILLRNRDYAACFDQNKYRELLLLCYIVGQTVVDE